MSLLRCAGMLHLYYVLLNQKDMLNDKEGSILHEILSLILLIS